MTDSKALVDAAICKAFTILFAYIIQEFYYEVVINNAYTKDEKTSTGFKATEELAIRVSWFAIVMALCPLMVRSARGSNPPGAQARPFFKNVKSLWGASIMMIIGWAFKDVCKALTQLYTPPKNCYETNTYIPVAESDACDAKSFGYRASYWGYAMAIAVAGISLNYFSRSGVGGMIDKIFSADEFRAMELKDKKKEGWFRRMMVNFSTKFRAARPLSLGIGLLCNHAMNAPWDWGLWYAIKYDNDGTSRPFDEGDYNFRWSCFLCTRNIVNTYLIVMLHLWFNRRTSAHGKEWEELTLGKFRWGLTETLVHSTSFNLAWSWADFIQFQFYTILFQCKIPFTQCGDYGIWLRAYYAIGLTGLMIVVVPILKQKGEMMRSLKGAYSSQILKKDLADFDNEVVYNGLYNAMFGIMVGWGWTGLLATACLSGYTFTCPDDYAVQRTILFAANSTFYVFLACGAYHIYMEGSRMAQRAAKVHLLEAGEAARFFAEADADKSGTIDKQEMGKFVDSYGFEVECFDLAFDRSDKIKGADGDDHVDLEILVNTFEVVVKEEYAKEKSLKKLKKKGNQTVTEETHLKTDNPLSPKSGGASVDGASIELCHQEPKASPDKDSHESAKITLKGGHNATLSSNADARSPSPPKRDQ